MDGTSLGAHKLKHFLRKLGMNNCHFPLKLESLRSPLYKSIQEGNLKCISLNTSFILVVNSARSLGELHPLVISLPCMHWWPDDSGVTIWPNPSFLPKVMSPKFVNQEVNLKVFCKDQPAQCSTVSSTCLTAKAGCWAPLYEASFILMGTTVLQPPGSHHVLIFKHHFQAGSSWPCGIRC